MSQMILSRWLRATLVSGLLGGGVYACKDLSSPLPAGVADPSAYNTPEAAIEMARSSRYYFNLRQFDVVQVVGLMTDELQNDRWGAPVGVFTTALAADARYFDVGDFDFEGITAFSRLHKLRGQVRLARSTLAAYAPDVPSSWRAEMLVYEGLANVMLADLFCSGISLSLVDFEKDYTYRTGWTTAQVYAEANVLFDSAIALSGDSTRIQYLARVSKARTLLALGQYAVADSVVAAIPDGYRFTLPLELGNTTAWNIRWQSIASVADREGENGLPFREPRDPRLRWVADGNNAYGKGRFTPPVVTAAVVGSAIEARLIQAEAALQRDDASWLTLLNALRTNGTVSVTVTPTRTDSVWRAGTGGVDSLRPLTDPALNPLPAGKTAFDVRLDLIFRERAFWLYLTGRRQGDLRRLVREYGRRIEETYPVGPYLGGKGSYSTWIDFPLNDKQNPLNLGCLSREENQ